MVVTRLDHDSNVRPWMQAAERAGAIVRWIDFDPETGELDLDSAAAAIGPRTRLVAVTGASNLIGTKPPLRAVADLAHAAGALVWVDGVHLAAHTFVDVRALGADFFVCSAYKFLGPHCSALVADPALLETIEIEKLAPSTNVVPERFEYGTLPYEQMAGVTAAIDLLAGLGEAASVRPAPRAARLRLRGAARARGEADRATRGGARGDSATASCCTPAPPTARPRRRSPSATARQRMPRASSRSGTSRSARATSTRTRRPSASACPTHAGLRMGVAPYTTEDEVDRLLAGLHDFLES